MKKKVTPNPLLCLLNVIFLLIFSSNSSQAENKFYDQPGFNPHREYFNQAPKEHIDPFTGNLLLTYTDIYLPGNGGLDLKIQRTYNSKIHKDITLNDFSPIAGSWVGLGWTLHMGRIVNANPQNVSTLRNTYVEMPDGSRHYLSSMPDNSGRFITNDFWTVKYVPTDVWEMTLKDGTVYTFANLVYDENLVPINYLTSIRDTNGNQITISYYACSQFVSTKYISQITDSVGRIITFSVTGDLCRKDRKLDYISVNGTTYFYDYSSFSYGSLTYYLLNSMTPPVGTPWYYFYNTTTTPNYELFRATYPSGGSIDYTFSTVSFFIGGNTIKFRAITSRTVSGASMPTGTWNYTYNMGGSGGDNTTIDDPCGNKEIYTFAGLGWSALNGKWQVGLITQKRIFQGASSTPVQTENYTWSKRFISYDQFDTDIDTYTPLLASKTTSRGGVNYGTNYNSYDAYGNPTSIAETGELSRTTTINYFYNTTSYIVDKPILHSVSNGLETRDITYTYDTTTGNLTSLNKYGVVTDFGYYPDGNVQWEKNARGIYTKYTYQYGVVKTIGYGATSPTGTPVYSVTRTINSPGTIASETNGRGYQTTFAYDTLNRLTRVTPAELGEAPTVISYDNTSGRWKKVAKDIYFIQSNFDGLGRLTDTSDSGGIKTDTNYNACGQKTYESYPHTSSNIGDSYTYDALGRVTKITHPDTKFVSYSYSGNSATITNERGISTTYNYKSFGDPDEKRLISVSDAVGITYYNYNLLGSLTLVDHPSGGDRTFRYNTKNFLDLETHPENGATSYVLDAIGNVTQKTDANGNVTGYTYDNLNRLTNINYPGTSYDVSFTYDKADNRITMSSPLATVNYTYDKSNRLTQKAATVSGLSCQTGFTYDKRNNVTNLTYPSGRSVPYTYDSVNRITAVTGYASSFTYHPSGAPLSFSHANTVSNTFTYDNRYRLVNLGALKGATNLVSLTHAYDGVGNVTGITDNLNTAKTQTLGYDPLDRLTSASGAWGGGSFQYDAIGNRTSKTIGMSTTTYSYSSANNRLTSSSGAEPATYTYDANGNIVGDGAFTYEYDPENRLIRIRSGATVIVEYFYDGDGIRVKKVSGGTTTVYCHSQGTQILSELNGSGGSLADYIYAGGRHVAMVRSGVTSYYHTDHLGSSIAMTNSAGTVAWAEDYRPFGEYQSGTGTLQNTHQYTGKEYELETGHYYYGARYYSPATGRFISVDPEGGNPENPQSWNRYAYTFNNPYKYVDSDGEIPILAPLAVAGAALLFSPFVANAPTSPNDVPIASSQSDLFVNTALSEVGGVALRKITSGIVSSVLNKILGNKVTSGSKIFFSQVAKPGRINDILKSANRPRGQTTELLRALDKRIGKLGQESAFAGVEQTHQAANSILREILERGEVTRAGQKTLDVFYGNRGARIELGTNKFKGLLEGTLNKKRR